ncbi:hypothetical protein HAX54_001371 [Datura stramonium]|uniref:Uncharacterized protein n=1 Tax=Datura stramonium TaxID=4076 RepID=A0ABS8T4H2_DATST|nr:hypothetical protein [Datura stramonium]
MNQSCLFGSFYKPLFEAHSLLKCRDSCILYEFPFEVAKVRSTVGSLWLQEKAKRKRMSSVKVDRRGQGADAGVRNKRRVCTEKKQMGVAAANLWNTFLSAFGLRWVMLETILELMEHGKTN